MFANMINVLTAPASTYETLISRKSIRDSLYPIMMLILFAVGSGYLLQDIIADLQWTESERRIENMAQLSEEKKSEVLENTYEKIYGEEAGGFGTLAIMGLSWPLRIAVMALFAMLIGNMFFGGGGSYKSVFILTAFAYSASIVEYIVKTPIQYFTENMEVFMGFGLLGLGERGSFLYNIMAGLDVFSFWRVILISIGMSILYKKSTQSFLIALTIFWLIELIFFGGLGALAVNLGS